MYLNSELKDIMNAVNELAVKLQNSELYSSYLSLKDKVLQDPELRYNITKFRRVQFEYETKRLRHIEPAFTEEQYVSKLYSDLMLNQDIRAFFEAERALLYIVKGLNENVLNVLKMDISFLNS